MTERDGDVDDDDVDDDDVAAFIAGWMQSAPVGVESWKKGDFNLNGATDLPDVYLMHGALAAQGGAFPFQQLFVPEPLSLQLGALAVFAVLTVTKRRVSGD